MIPLIIGIFILLISIYIVNNLSGLQNIDDLINYPDTQKDITFVNTTKNIKDINRDITLEQVGCYKNISDKFFLRKINPFAKTKTFDSVLVVSDQKDYETLFNAISNNGFVDFINFIKKKYTPDTYKNISMQELAALGRFAGYSYISIYRTSNNGPSRIYFTYSQPLISEITSTQSNLDKFKAPPDFPNYNVISKNKDDPDSCGYQCTNPDGSPQVNGLNGIYNCGSINYKNIKSPITVSVYKIVENI
jgi:hypothetical protein